MTGLTRGRHPGQGNTAADRKAAPPGAGQRMVLPLPGRGSKGGRVRGGQYIDPPETEYGRAIYCDVTDSGALRGGGETTGGTSPTAVVGTVGN